MADDTIVEEPTGQSGQVENPPNEPESAGDGEYVPSATGTIAMRTDSHSDQVDKAVWSTAYVNDLPDSSFLYVESGEKEDGKTTPRSKRHFPYKDANGKIDLPHLRNAIARIPQSNAPGLTAAKKRSLQERARRLLGNQDKEMYDEGMAMPMGYPLYGVTSFAELDDLQQAEEAGHHAKMLTDQFQMMVGNIMCDPTITDKGVAINRLTSEFTTRLKQPMKSKSIIDVVRNLFAKKIEEKANEPVDDHLPAQVTAPFMIWKDSAGQYRWFAIYSNQFRDEDNPPEIISEKSHRNFIDLVDAGAVDYPELWHWHTPGTAWGKADWLDYADGFAVASGYVYEGHEKEAEAISQLDDIRVSHGMPSRFIVRNKQDPTIIDVHVTAEISDLPGYAAANPLTQFVVLNKELDMGLNPDKKQYLVQAGLSSEVIAELEKTLATKKEAADNAGLESKESTPAEPTAETPAETPTQPAYVTAQEVADAVTSVIAPFTEALTAVTSQLAAMQAEVKALKQSDEEKIAEKSSATPRASLQALLAHSIGGMAEAQIDGRTTLAKAGPKQAPQEAEAVTGMTYIDKLIAQSRAEVAQ